MLFGGMIVTPFLVIDTVLLALALDGQLANTFVRHERMKVFAEITAVTRVFLRKTFTDFTDFLVAPIFL